jgi:WD40 repeat protein
VILTGLLVPASAQKSQRPDLIVQLERRNTPIGWLPDSRTVVSAGRDGRICLWDAMTGEVRRVFGFGDPSVAYRQISADGKFYYQSVSDDPKDSYKNVRIEQWSLENGIRTRTWKLPGFQTGWFTLTPKQDAILTQNEMDEVRLISLNKAGKSIDFKTNGFGTWAAISPDGSRLSALCFVNSKSQFADGSNSVEFFEWDVSTGRQLARRQIFSTRRGIPSYSRDGRLIACPLGERVLIYRSGSGQVVSELPVIVLGQGTYEWSLDSSLLSVPKAGITRQTWSVSSAKMLGEEGVEDKGMVSPDGKLGITSFAGSDGQSLDTITVTTFENSKTVFSTKVSGAELEGIIGTLPGSKLFATTMNNALAMVDIDQGTIDDIRVFGQESDMPSPKAVSPNGTLVACYANQKVQVYELGTNKLLWSTPPRSSGWWSARTILFSQDGNTLLIAWHVGIGNSFPGPEPQDCVQLHDAQSGRVIFSMPGYRNLGSRAAFSPDGKKIVTYGLAQNVEVFDVVSHERVASFPTDKRESANDAAVVGAYYVVTRSARGSSELSCWEIPLGTRRWFFKMPGGRGPEMALSKNGTTLIVYSETNQYLPNWEDGSYVIDVQSGRVDKATKRQMREAIAVPFGKGNRTGFLAQSDGSLALVDIASGTNLVNFRLIDAKSEDNKLVWLVTTPDGYYNGSPGVEKWLRWRVGEKLLPGEALPERRRPDVIKAILDKYR